MCDSLHPDSGTPCDVKGDHDRHSAAVPISPWNTDVSPTPLRLRRNWSDADVADATVIPVPTQGALL